jgi:hypothetical protein
VEAQRNISYTNDHHEIEAYTIQGIKGKSMEGDLRIRENEERRER